MSDSPGKRRPKRKTNYEDLKSPPSSSKLENWKMKEAMRKAEERHKLEVQK